MRGAVPRAGRAAAVVAVASAAFGLAAAASLTSVLPVGFPSGRGAAGFPAFYYSREGLELPAFLLAMVFAPVAAVVGLRLWARLSGALGARPERAHGDPAVLAAVPFLGLLAVVPSLPLVAGERAPDLGTAALLGSGLALAGWWAASRNPTLATASAVAVGALASPAACSAVTSLGPWPSWAAAAAGAVAAGWLAARRPRASGALVPVSLIPLVTGLGLDLVAGGELVRQGLGRGPTAALVGLLLAAGVALALRERLPMTRPGVAVLAMTLAVCGVALNPAVDRVDLDLYGEGEYLATAQAVRDGGAPFRDVVLMHGFGADLLKPLLAFELFGLDARALRLLDAALVPLAVAAAAAVAWRCLAPGGVAVSLLLVTALGPSMMGLDGRTLVSLLAMIPFLAAIDRPRWGTAALAGGAAVAATAWAFDSGGAVLVGEAAVALVAVVLVRDRGRPLAVGFALGVAAGLAVAVTWLAATGILRPFLAAEADLLASFERAYGLPFAFALTYSPAPWLAFAVPAVAVAALALLLHRALAGRLGPWELKLATTVAVSGALYRRALDRSDLGHLVLATHAAWIPALMLLGLLLVRRESRLAAAMAAALLLAVPAPELLPGRRTAWGVTAWLGSRGVTDLGERVALPGVERLGIRVSPEQAGRISPLLAAVGQARPGVKVLDLTNHGAVLFLADRENATRYPQIWSASSPARQDEVASAVAADPPPMVIWRSGTGYDRLDRIDNLVRHHRVAAALNRRATGVREAGPFLLLELGEGERPAAERSPVEGLDLGHLPLVWGGEPPPGEEVGAWGWDPQRARPVGPAGSTFEVTGTGPAFALELPDRGPRPAALALELAADEPVAASLAWVAREHPERSFAVRFAIPGDGLPHVHWLPLDSHPGWAWARRVERVVLAFDRTPVTVRLGSARAVELP